MSHFETKQPDPAQVGFNYYLTCCKFYFSNSTELVQMTFDRMLKLFLLSENVVEKNKIRKILNLCLKKGANLKLPILKIKGRDKKNNWLYNFPSKEVIESVDVYDFLIQNENVSVQDKAKLDSLLLQSFMADLILLKYKKQDIFSSQYLKQKAVRANKLGYQYHATNEIENIIHRGHVFKSQLSRFLVLSCLFSYRELFDSISLKSKLLCYQEFEKLSLIGKKTLASLLLKNRNEEALYNLLRYGLKLNWDISVEDGKKNLLAFEMLYSLQWVKVIVENRSLDIRLTNNRGENILHLIGSGALEDVSIENSLRRKINELTCQEKLNLFFQENEDGLTPLMKAVIFQDEKLIDFITGFGVKPWDKVAGSTHESTLDFLNKQILSQGNNESMWDALMDVFKESFWYGLAKKWNAEYYYLNLQGSLVKNSNTQKKVSKV